MRRLRTKRRYGNELVPATPSECGECSLAYGSTSLGFLKEALFLSGVRPKRNLPVALDRLPLNL